MLSGEIRVNERSSGSDVPGDAPSLTFRLVPTSDLTPPKYSSFHPYFRQVIRTVNIMQVTTESNRATVAKSNDPQGSDCDKYAMTSQPRASAFIGKVGLGSIRDMESPQCWALSIDSPVASLENVQAGPGEVHRSEARPCHYEETGPCT